MIFGHSFGNIEHSCNPGKRHRALEKQFQELNLRFIERARFWAKAIKFLLKVCHLRLKLRSLRFSYLKLSAENSNLSRKQCELLLLKINYIFFDSGISERLYDACVSDAMRASAGCRQRNARQ